MGRLLAILTVLLGAAAAWGQDLAGEVRALNAIGFQQFQEVSRFFVVTTEPVQYRIDSSRPDVVELVLENTSVPHRNNSLHLDTSFFESPVRFIQPKIIEGPSPSVRILIYLREKVPFKEVQSDNRLWLDFVRR